MIGNSHPVYLTNRYHLSCISGSFLLARIVNYYPNRFLALTWLAIGYSPPSGGEFPLDMINADSEALLGYPVFGYWEFFNDPKIVELVDQNVSTHVSRPAPRTLPLFSSISNASFPKMQVESFLSLMFASDPKQLKTSFCPYGAARAWVTAGKTSPLPHYLTPAEFRTHASFFSSSHGGSFGPPLE